MSFKEQYPEIQHLAWELKCIREHNRESPPPGTLLLFAEAVLCCLTIERFIRIVLQDEAKDSDTLQNLLDKATSKSRRLLQLPWEDQQDGKAKVTKVRNSLLHGNFEQAAKECGCKNVMEYFKAQFAGEIEGMYQVLDHLMKQIDPTTGKRYEPLKPR